MFQRPGGCPVSRHHTLIALLAGGFAVCVVLIIVQAWVHAEYRERCNPLDGCGPVTPPPTLRQATAGTDTMPATTPHTNATTSPLASTSTPTEATDSETTSTATNKPTLTSISPKQGPHGTIITLTGANLAGFEGNLDAWIKDEIGTTAYLPQFSGQPHSNTAAGTDTIRIELPERACTTNNTYSGNECEKYLELIPGEYHLYAWPFGEPSNELTFTVTDLSGCAALTEAQCFQTAHCKAHYGPSTCVNNECTDDETFTTCAPFGEADRTRALMPLANTSHPFTGLAYVTVESWPPLVYDGFLDVPTCPIGDNTIRGTLSKTSLVTVSDATYCRTTTEAIKDTGTEHTYVYTTSEAMGSLKLWLTLTFADCSARAGTEQAACVSEQAALDLDQTIDTLIRALLTRA